MIGSTNEMNKIGEALVNRLIQREVRNGDRKEKVQRIYDVLVDELLVASIEHTVIPIIAAMSLDDLTQEEWNNMGCDGPKPPPLQEKHKITIYNKLKAFFKPVILSTIKTLANEMAFKFTSELTEEQLNTMSRRMNVLVRFKEMQWHRFQDLLKDHSCLFQELKQKTNFNFDAVKVHDMVCPLLEKAQEPKDFLDKLGVREIIALNDQGK